ncbi:hypothetical protein EYF80_034407 [Liparis tanakae]|uniref:Uncharacterized protein n=1 Tax=Liparis tanakae TaxID=230148 RepID=A0A4Z2GQM2_9TELE|nr:hypothetical protein EYF80_034407 [Liparis tanakae]
MESRVLLCNITSIQDINRAKKKRSEELRVPPDNTYPMYRVSQSMRQAVMLYVEKYSESMGVDLQSPQGGGRYWS